MYAENDEKDEPMNKSTSDAITKEEFIKNAVSKLINDNHTSFQAHASQYESANSTTGRVSPYKKSLSCYYCFKIFDKRQTLERHERVHTGEKPFKCDECDKSFTQSYYLNQHKKRHRWEDEEKVGKIVAADSDDKSVDDFSCYICSKRFTLRADLVRHERIHTGDKPYKCDLCDKFFAQSGQLAIHKKRHTGIKPFSCDICGKAFLLEYQMNIHRRVHTKERPFSCDVCGKGFSINSLLQNHKKTHTDKAPFPCDFCGKPFFEERFLTNHRRIHTGEKPFICNVCGKAFTHISSWRKHTTAHKTKKGLSCELCDKVFIKHTHLTAHKQKDHFIQMKYTCTICKQEFNEKVKLMLHKKIHITKKKISQNKDSNKIKIIEKEEIMEVKDEPMDSDNSDTEPSIMIECKAGEGWEEDVKDAELTKAIKEVVNVNSNPAHNTNSDIEAVKELKEETYEEVNDIDVATFLEASIHTENSAQGLEIKAYFCNICGKKYARKDSLVIHTSTMHSTEKPFSCDICSKSFAIDKQLRRHIKLHTGDRKFSCRECGKSFKDNSYLKRHMDTHNENPYICKVCGNSFRRKDNLQRHKKLHGHEDPSSDVDKKFELLSCNVCEVMFADQETLETHKLSHDKDETFLNLNQEENILLGESVQVQLKEEPTEEHLS